MTARGMAFGPFLEALNRRLDRMSESDLKEAIRALAVGLRPVEREPFLAGLSRPSERQPASEELLDEIEDLFGRIRAGEFYEGWGWDDSIHAERGFGDESWAGEMDMLFDKAAEAFLAGDLDLARKAYGLLLHAIWDGGDVAEQLPGEDPPELLETDMAEAAARYLRALYETTTPERRAEELLDEISDLPVWPSLGDLRVARGKDLPGLVEFLPDWIGALRSDGRGESYSGRDRALLTEAVLLHGGTDGLIDLARDRGARQPELYLELVGQLEREGQVQRTLEAAREALAMVPAGEVRARIADRLGGLEIDSRAGLEARRAAWRAMPSRDRLVALVRAARDSGDQSGVLNEECDLLPPPGRRGQRSHDERLVCALMLIAGRVDAAIDRTRALDDDWADSEHPGHVLLPYLGLAAVGAARMPSRAPVLKASLAEVDRQSRWGGHWIPGFDRARDGEGRVDDEPARPGGSLASLLEESLPGGQVDAEARNRWLGLGQEMTASAVAAVVGGTRRHAYELVARLVVGHAEALATAGAAGREFVVRFRAGYPRHVAFRRDLDRLSAGSPILAQR